MNGYILFAMDRTIQDGRGAIVARSLSLLVLSLLSGAALCRLTPPADVDSASGFDTSRAMAHLQFIASEPHPHGSPHNRAVRAYLVEQFRTLGLDVELQDAVVPAGPLHGLPVEVVNVVARLRGSHPSQKAVMLAAHYDSTRVAASPGAGDDGAAVAAILEVARILAADPPRNDVIFLLTDGEEIGLLGARAFVRDHRWKDDAGVVFNFEARGTRGPSIMFETSPDDAWLVAQFAQVAPHPVAASLSQSIYRMMPNNTDFTIFRQAGMRGLNFAFIGGHANYHTVRDDLAHLDPRSVRHHGVQALALARRFGELDLDAPVATGDAVYFHAPLPGVAVIRYDAVWALPFAGMTYFMTALAIVVVARRKTISLPGTIWASAIFVLSIAASAALSWCALALLSRAALERNANLSIAAFTALSVVCISVLVAIFRKRASADDLLAIWLVICSTLAVVTAIFLPGASFIVTWPALFGALGMLARTMLFRGSATARTIVMTLASAPLVLLATPMIYLSFLGLRIRAAPLMIGAVVLLLWGLVWIFDRRSSHHSAVSGGGGA